MMVGEGSMEGNLINLAELCRYPSLRQRMGIFSRCGQNWKRPELKASKN